MSTVGLSAERAWQGVLSRLPRTTRHALFVVAVSQASWAAGLACHPGHDAAGLDDLEPAEQQGLVHVATRPGDAASSAAASRAHRQHAPSRPFAHLPGAGGSREARPECLVSVPCHCGPGSGGSGPVGGRRPKRPAAAVVTARRSGCPSVRPSSPPRTRTGQTGCSPPRRTPNSLATRGRRPTGARRPSICAPTRRSPPPRR